MIYNFKNDTLFFNRYLLRGPKIKKRLILRARINRFFTLLRIYVFTLLRFYGFMFLHFYAFTAKCTNINHWAYLKQCPIAPLKH